MTFSDVISKWPKPNTRTLAADLGAKENTVKQWKKRGSIPSNFWLEVESAARRRGIDGVTVFTLAEIAAAERVQA